MDNASDFGSFYKYKYIVTYKTFYHFWEQRNLLCVVLKTHEDGSQWTNWIRNTFCYPE